MQPMHDPGIPQPAHAGPRLSCGVGRTCDVEAAAEGMLRRLVRSYEGVLPRSQVACTLRDFVALMRRFAASNAARTPREDYPPAVHIMHGGDDGGGCAEEGMHAESEGGVEQKMRVMVKGAGEAIACVLATLVATSMTLQAELERQVWLSP